VLRQAQEQLDQGRSLREVAAALGVKYDTLSKALRDGRLHEAVKKKKNRSNLTPSRLT
jgi:predicted site-specific integrase-resolvase